MNDTRQYLKIKIVSLMDEARTIRKEEAKTTDRVIREGMHNHRVVDIRRESRAALLAYGFIKGLAYREMEQQGSSDPDYKRVASLVKKYGAPGDDQNLDIWYSSGFRNVRPRTEAAA